MLKTNLDEWKMMLNIISKFIDEYNMSPTENIENPREYLLCKWLTKNIHEFYNIEFLELEYYNLFYNFTKKYYFFIFKTNFAKWEYYLYICNLYILNKIEILDNDDNRDDIFTLKVWFQTNYEKVINNKLTHSKKRELFFNLLSFNENFNKFLL